MPKAASWKVVSFSTGACGAWSVATQSRVPSARPLDERVDVGLLAQRGVDLAGRVVPEHGLRGEREVVRRHLGGDVEALGLRGAHEGDAPRGAGVGEVVARAGELREHEVAGDDVILRDAGPALESEARGDGALVHLGAFGERVVFGVLHHHEAVGAGVLQGAAHHARVGDAAAVVGDGDAARGAQVGHLRELATGLTAGDGADGVDAHEPVVAPLGDDHLGDGAVVVDGLRVGHRAHHDEAPGGGGAGARDDVLFVLVARLAQVRVQVDEARTAQRPRASMRCTDSPAMPLRRTTADARDAALLDHQIGLFVAAVLRVDDPCRSDHQHHGRATMAEG
jgi:hypothetical protein